MPPLSAPLPDVRNPIRQARAATAEAVHGALVLLYWQIGEEIVPTRPAQLTGDFGTWLEGGR